jgi:cystatin-A/B
MMCGGVNPTISAPNDEVNALAATHKAAAEAALGANYATWNVTGFSTQVVAGTNYWIKVNVGGDNHVHLKIWKKLDGTTEFTTANGGQTATSAFV